ncbi:MAG: DUF4376 domain-containing protein [Richelia sp. RM2_1_2]|nr:DUF4376 domain-containing protein [Richelia sp. RM2_1_2]
MSKLEIYNVSGELLDTIDTRTLSDVKNNKKSEVNSYRDQILNSGVTFNDTLFDSTQDSRQNLAGYSAAIASGVPLPDNFTWRDASNVNQSMTESDLLSFSSTMITFVNNVYSSSWTHKNAIDALATIEEVDNYDYTGGWPSN